ncbi:MAG: chloride channel protein [candidate division Zixibacteria bacterium]|nr:chloride channel protein [candidate division Zixibacteria bacterium]MBU2626499.1 chloride channel protein [candidate division Zixibacteria bacterium]
MRLARLLYKRFARKVTRSETALILVLASVVGISTGLAAVAFIWLIQNAKELFFGRSVFYLNHMVTSGDFWVILIPAIGGAIAGPIVYNFAKEARGHGVPEVMEAVALKGGIIRPRVAVAKSLASAVCIGSGGSAGREGPIIQIGSTIGSTIGQLFNMSGSRVKILVGCGAAAGISAVFNAPIAGVIFSLEIILGDYAVRTFSPVIFSSVIASVISRAFLGNHPAFVVPAYSLVSAWEIPLYIGLGVIGAFVALAFTHTLYFTEDRFDSLKIPGAIKPIIGGLAVGAIGFFFPQVFSDGYETIINALNGDLSIKLLAGLVLLKIAATSFTLGSGNSGGIFAPSLFMGAIAGGLYGEAVHYLFPAVTASSGAYALVGMAAVVSGTTYAPITALLIIFEMTGDYRIVLPLMIVVVSATLVASRITNESIYTLKLIRRGINLRGGRDKDVMESIKVSEVMDSDYDTIGDVLSLDQVFNVMENSRSSFFPVIDYKGNLVGTLSFQDLRSILVNRRELAGLVIAQDICHSNPPVLHPDNSLDAALEKFALRDLEFLPVVSREDDRKLVGILNKNHIFRSYHKKLLDKISKS